MLQATPQTRASTSATAGISRLSAIAPPQVAALGFFLALMALVLAGVLARTGGRLIYSLDDVYIHLALAERLAQGHYGINLGEVTSPSSSVIWPFLMIPGAGTPLHQYLPLALNTGLGAITALLYGRVAAGLPLPAGLQPIAIACLLVLATNLAGLAFTGLEHNLQVLIAVAVAVALVERRQGAPLPAWALIAAALGPSVRYEMFAITAALGLVLLLERRWRTLALMLAGSLFLPALLSAFLVLNGNLPLPNSVMAKLMGLDPANPDLPWLTKIARDYWYANFAPKNAMLAVLVLFAIGWREIKDPAWRHVMGAGLLAGLLHLGFGQFGWFYRYEVYALAFCGLIALTALARIAPRYALIAVGLAASLYIKPIHGTWHAAHNIYEQQYQMQRFVKDHYAKSFAVNDLGWVSFGLDRGIYVLDLWGLASNEAVRQRVKNAEWLDAVTRRHNTGLAMIYPIWFKDIPASWTKVGELTISGPMATVAWPTVDFYATAAGDAAEIATKLAAFKAELPPGVMLRLASR